MVGSRSSRCLAPLLLGAVLAGPLASCHHNEGDSLVVTGDGTKLSSEAIDQDPFGLLPANPIVLSWVDAQAFFASPFGGEIARIAGTRLPLGQESGFVPQRDLKRLVGGAYSMSGADAVIVAQGDFQPEMIKSAADQHAATPLGPLVHSTYAGNDVYTVRNVGFTVLTRHTMLIGNETGMRRALDRIRDNRLKRELPDWMLRLMDNPQASAILAGDVASQPMVAALARSAPFLNGLSSFRMLGNFQAPGLNVAGALSYPDAASAANGASSLRGLVQMAGVMSMLSLFGLGSPLKNMQIDVQQNDVQFVMAVDGQTVTRLLAGL
jgi:hypothetical protein